MTNLSRDLRTQAVVSQRLIQVIQECRSNQKVIHDDGLLSHRRITGAKDRSTRLMVISSHTSCVDELQGLAITQGAWLDSAFSNTSRFICLDHLTRKQFQVSCILSIIVSSTLGQTKARSLVDITSCGNTHIDIVSAVSTGCTRVRFRVGATLSRKCRSHCYK